MPWLPATDGLNGNPMPANKKLLILPGDGIGPEVMREVRRVIDWMDRRRMVDVRHLGGPGRRRRRSTRAARRSPTRRWRRRKDADAILFGSVGGPKWDKLGFDCGRNWPSCGCARSWTCSPTCGPAIVLDPLVDASTLKPEVVRGLDLMIVRESTGGIYFGEPRGIETLPGRREARLRHRDLHHERDRARRARGVRAGAQAAEPRDQRGEGERDAVRPVLAPDRHRAARARICRCAARPHVRRQLRHAAGAQLRGSST